jgi:3-oxoacyl-[acyl-carrier protein] reductase
MSERFSGKLAVVTGGRSGIGAACVARFASEGAEVVSLDITDPDAPVDVTDETAVDAFFAELGRAPDILVNGAGTGTLARIVDMPFAEWRRVLSINLDGTFLCLRAAARLMVSQGVPGTIVNIASINQEWAVNGFAPYCASKAGVQMLTKVAALELAPQGIRVNAVAPGPIDTPLLGPLAGIPGIAEALAARTPLGARLGSPEDVASVIAFLASDDSGWIAGRSIVVDGGHLLRGEPDFMLLLEGRS